MEELNLTEQALNKANLAGVFNLEESTAIGNTFYSLKNKVNEMVKENGLLLKTNGALEKKLGKSTNADRK